MILTKRQKQILSFIEESIRKNGYAPSLDEISRHFELHSISTIHKHLVNLEDKGFIKRHWNRARAIEVLAVQALRPVNQVHERQFKQGFRLVRVPVVTQTAGCRRRVGTVGGDTRDVGLHVLVLTPGE